MVIIKKISMFSISIFPSINPITGVVEEEQPNPMEGMTEEQKEYEAMKLVDMFDKLSRSVKSTHSHLMHAGQFQVFDTLMTFYNFVIMNGQVN